MKALTRRRLLLEAALGLAGAALAPAARAATASADGPARRVSRRLGWGTSAAVIGRRYLREHPAEASEARLLRSLGPWIHLGDPESLRRTAAARVRADFAEGRTVRVEGWILSRTEARLAALAVF